MQHLSSNGIAPAANGHSRVAYPVAALDASEPLDAVLEMGRKASRFTVLAILFAVAVHGAAITRAALIPIDFMHWSHMIGRTVHERLVSTYEVDLVKPPELPPLPPPPEPEKEQPKEPPPPAPVKEVAPAAAPAAAQAGAVLVAPPDPNEPVNFDGIINGPGDTFAGGNTTANGTSQVAVRVRPAAAGGVPGGTGAASTGPRDVDRSRVAKVSGSTDWHCPFPPEADVEQVDQAFVMVQVAARADGSAEHVTILSDPGHGFGRAAQRCAMQERYDPALDHDGNPIAGLTKSIRVRFER
jgi:periplasmic protein TonB